LEAPYCDRSDGVERAAAVPEPRDASTQQATVVRVNGRVARTERPPIAWMIVVSGTSEIRVGKHERHLNSDSRSIKPHLCEPDVR
jgi:hypothetical protein